MDKENQEKIELIKKLLAQLSEDEYRILAIDDFCHYCGRMDPSCQCWNDE